MDKVINEYKMVVSGNVYQAPEIRRFFLQGIAGWIEGDEPCYVLTSPVVKVEGNVVTTRSGSRYVMGTKHPESQTFEELRKDHPHVPME